MRSSKPLTLRIVTAVENSVFWLLPCEDLEYMVFLMKTRRTGMDAAMMVIAVSAVARIMRVQVATWTSLLVLDDSKE